MDETAATHGQAAAGWADILGASLFGVSLGSVLLAGAILAVAFACRPWIGDMLRYGLERIARRSQSTLDDDIVEAVTEPAGWLPIGLGFLLAAEALALPGLLGAALGSLAETLLAGAVFWALLRLVPVMARTLRAAETPLTPPMADWTVKAARILVWLVGAATILELWGIRVVPIIAGLGLVGVAVALGAQDLFKNLISGVLILSERRFCVGDWIKVDGVVEGTVEEINFRSTKVRRFDRAPVYVPNTAFADGAVVNFGEMSNRRVAWTIGLEYRATAAQLQAIRDKVAAAILADDRFLPPDEGPCFVRLDAFSDSSVDLMIYVFTKTRDWGEWLSIKEDLLLAIKRIVEEEGAGFAFPSRSLYLEPSGAFERPLQVALEPGGSESAEKTPARKAAAPRRAASKAASDKAGAAKTSAAKSSAVKTPAAKTPAAKAPAAKEATPARGSRGRSRGKAASSDAGEDGAGGALREAAPAAG